MIEHNLYSTYLIIYKYVLVISLIFVGFMEADTYVIVHNLYSTYLIIYKYVLV